MSEEHKLPGFQKGARRPEGEKPQWMQCGLCKTWWDNSLITSKTPVPSGRCPFEWEHVEPKPEPNIKKKPQYPGLLCAAIDTLNFWRDTGSYSDDWYTDLLDAVREEMIAWED